MTAPPALAVRDLSVAYGARLALDAVTFDAPAGCVIGVIGPNGAGKSTLFKAILGVLPHTGSVTAPGRIAYVPQGDRADHDFPATAFDVALMGRYGGTPWWRRLSAQDRAAARAALDEMGMLGHADCSYGELSGGQRQRVILARALAQEGQVVLMDEPMTGVDATSATVIAATIERLRDAGGTILVATHDLNDAARSCDRLLFLNRRVIADGTPAETFTAETLNRTYEGALLMVRPEDGTPIGVLDEGAHHDHDHGTPGDDHDHPHVHERDS